MAQGFDQKIRAENQALRQQLAASEAQLKQSTAALEHFKKQQDRVREAQQSTQSLAGSKEKELLAQIEKM